MFIDIFPIDDNGNLLDASAIAVISALLNAKVPQVQLTGDDTFELRETYRPIKMKSIPVSLTSTKIANYNIYDATNEEEIASNARLTLGFTEEHIVSGQKGGSGVYSSDEFLGIVKKSHKKSVELREKILNALRDSEEALDS